MEFNEAKEEGLKSDRDKHGTKVEEDNTDIEVTTAEEIADQTGLFVEYVEPDRKSGRDQGPDFGGQPSVPQPPSPSPPPDVPDLGDVENPFEDFGDEIDFGNIDFSDTVGLLQAQLQLMNVMSDLLVRIASQQERHIQFTQQNNAFAQSNFEVNRRILSNVRPFRLVTVSGTNEIENANNPEEVVPESEETDIPTRELSVKSSRGNSEKIWFGDDETSPNSGFSLSPGEATTIEVDLREQSLYMASPEPDQVVELLGVA